MQVRWIGDAEKWTCVWNKNWQNPELQNVAAFVAYCSDSGAREVIKAHAARNVELHLVVGLNDGVTDIHARDALFDWQETNSRIEIKTEKLGPGRFHPKVYVFHYADCVRVLIGSVNLTSSAFYHNTEASVEWQMTPEEYEQSNLRQTLDEWWSNAKPIKKPDLKERILDTMNQGIFVSIEAHLATARFHIPKDIFGLGRNINIIIDGMEAKRNSSTAIRLTEDEIFKVLEDCGEEARKNCKRFSFPTDSGRFLPSTAIEDWKKEHNIIEAKFAQEVKRFDSDEERKKIRIELEENLAKKVRAVWGQLPESDPVSEDKIKEASAKVLKAFDKVAPDFSRTIILSVTVTPCVFPSLQGMTHRNSIIRTLIREFAEKNPNGDALSWMLCLIRTTRQNYLLGISQLLKKGVANEEKVKRERDLICQMRALNFYKDGFCNLVVEALESIHHGNETYRKLCDWARRDLEEIEGWPYLTHEEVMDDFARLIGWTQPTIKLWELISVTQRMELDFNSED